MQKKIQEITKKIAGTKKPDELTPDEQKKIREEIAKALGGGRGGAPGGMNSGAPGAMNSGAPGPMNIGPQGPGMAPGCACPAWAADSNSATRIWKAKLPPAPEEDSQFDVLLRPGLLADVEIIVDKIPNAISIPTQAVFEKDGKLVAYVKKGKGLKSAVHASEA